MAAVPWSPVAGGISLAVRLTPKGGRDAFDGVEIMPDGNAVLKVRVRVAPAEGQANAALTGLVAKAVGLPRRDVTLVSGPTSRLKRLVISGHGPTLIAALEKIAASR
jgi:uncharacterized protein YggU (UPF0235/DUF167 family)